MGRIKVLPQLLVDKIAAGEVIERPASVVKELIENSLDAGASYIKIDIAEGGKRSIRISDNGSGVLQEDLKLLFVRHATSKISTEKELFSVKSLGFRGEALASIASVSQIKVVSKTESQPEAWEITAQESHIDLPRPATGLNGTMIEINNLFFNTPARQKFLKSNSVEFGHITDVVTRYALSYPCVRFDLVHNNEPVINLPETNDVTNRFKYILGEELVSSFVKTENRENDWFLTAYMSTPVHTKSTMKMQWIYLNGRYIRDRIISRAIIQAYSDFIPPHRFPVVIMFLDLPAQDFDVNVHPTKIEVRFRNTWQVHNMITASIRKVLTSSDFIEAKGESNGLAANKTAVFADNRILQAMVDFFGAHPNKDPAIGVDTELNGKSDIYTDNLSKGPLLTYPAKEFYGQNVISSKRYIQIHNAYIIEEVVDGLIIIDQHALHERLIYERLLEDDKNKGTIVQQLLIPETLELGAGQMTIIKDALPHLTELGFQIEEFGRDNIIIRAVPGFIGGQNIKDIIVEIVQSVSEEGDVSGKSFNKSSILKLVACKAAIKSGMRLSDGEISALLEQYHQRGVNLKGELTCPHGRPSVYKLTNSQLARFFAR
ncbi:MAG: DNA mismatch repair endonuclease MutL [Planctomycetes bacterium]|nr:DNA mismatch repair endonuclease MutL [Planctomycetota bacterium]